jgi:hypothetical protein
MNHRFRHGGKLSGDFRCRDQLPGFLLKLEAFTLRLKPGLTIGGKHFVDVHQLGRSGACHQLPQNIGNGIKLEFWIAAGCGLHICKLACDRLPVQIGNGCQLSDIQPEIF